MFNTELLKLSVEIATSILSNDQPGAKHRVELAPDAIEKIYKKLVELNKEASDIDSKDYKPVIY